MNIVDCNGSSFLSCPHCLLGEEPNPWEDGPDGVCHEKDDAITSRRLLQLVHLGTATRLLLRALKQQQEVAYGSPGEIAHIWKRLHPNERPSIDLGPSLRGELCDMMLWWDCHVSVGVLRNLVLSMLNGELRRDPAFTETSITRVRGRKRKRVSERLLNRIFLLCEREIHRETSILSFLPREVSAESDGIVREAVRERTVTKRRAKDRALAAFFDLCEELDRVPTRAEIAERAGVDESVVSKHSRIREWKKNLERNERGASGIPRATEDQTKADGLRRE